MNDAKHNSEEMHFGPIQVHDEAVRAFVDAAEALAAAGESTQAELRFRQALRQAENSTGTNGADARCVTELMLEFYSHQDRIEDALSIKQKLDSWGLTDSLQSRRTLESRFVKRRSERTESSIAPARNLPPEIRNACHAIGMSGDLEPTAEEVTKAWKQAIMHGAGHPDLGGQVELSIMLNTAKDSIMQWLDKTSPKLGRHFDSIAKL